MQDTPRSGNSSPLVHDGAFTVAALGAPVHHALAALARDRIVSVRRAWAALAGSDDPEALHDFRVAIRRLRSLVRGYRPQFRQVLGGKTMRRLRQLARATNASRDLEVKLAWLGPRHEGLRPRDRTGLRWLLQRLEARKRRADAEAVDLIEENLDPELDALDARLVELAVEASPDSDTLRAASAPRLLRRLEAFRSRFSRIRGATDQDAAHRTRIAGKQIRYLLEPLVELVPDARQLVTRLKRFQDVTGEMHDAEVLAAALAEAMEMAAADRGERMAEHVRAEGGLDRATLRRERRRDPTPGLVALATQAQQRREAAWRVFEEEFRAGAEAILFRPVREVAAGLADPGAASLEIERKFLLESLPPRALEAPMLEMEQGYLPGARIRERLRRAEGGDGTRWYRTLKSGIGMVREEIEEETTQEVFAAMWPLTAGRRVRKRRYRVPEGVLVWEIDEFVDRDLVLAEVELPDPRTEVQVPEWLREYVVAEVTGDPAYLNSTLAR